MGDRKFTDDDEEETLPSPIANGLLVATASFGRVLALCARVFVFVFVFVFESRAFIILSVRSYTEGDEFGCSEQPPEVHWQL